MERITISLEAELAEAFDALIAERGYRNRSEAMRDLLRAELERSRQRRDASAHCVASLSYVYNHQERELAERLARHHHAHHDLSVSTLQSYLDHEHCLACSILRGPTRLVRQLAERIMAESGVRHGHLNLVSLTEDGAEHRHVRGLSASHRHFRPVD
ncbi:nickel-responsive transcriptional regulator NikR [Stutzerimonas stutzeri]|uniref:Putative nickel-responsive regulator n=1 Tax=Stutzerimonas stutzeri TaxID=316 RepID=A0A2N8SXC8_STUST|nr:nickel-responsive transcriptional regulator NikR [Stutzerimonas stutzeri]MCQ4327108.1 nickel-responsive transcriptional regulator NikR [Stutzerimonas stutzeri]PNG07139.1 nickel-responsive transcriptional regulator NikR [Stutzerimonas stutzeri]